MLGYKDIIGFSFNRFSFIQHSILLLRFRSGVYLFLKNHFPLPKSWVVAFAKRAKSMIGGKNLPFDVQFIIVQNLHKSFFKIYHPCLRWQAIFYPTCSFFSKNGVPQKQLKCRRTWCWMKELQFHTWMLNHLLIDVKVYFITYWFAFVWFGRVDVEKEKKILRI